MQLAACGIDQNIDKEGLAEAYQRATAKQTKPCLLDPSEQEDIEVVHGVAFVGATLNGVAAPALLDTGGYETLLTPALADAAHLTRTGFRHYSEGVSGGFAVDDVIVKDARWGGLKMDSVFAGRYAFNGLKDSKLLLIGLNWLSGVDYDIDLPNHHVRAYFTQDCGSVEPPWRDTATGILLSHKKLEPHYRIPVAFGQFVVDGTLDTGAASSFMSYRAAERAGVTDGDLNSDPVTDIIGMSGQHRKLRHHKFASVMIGEETLHDFAADIPTGFDRRDDELIIGLDFLRHHRFWLSTTTQSFYIDSGEPRKPTPPFDKPRQIVGPYYPILPPMNLTKNTTLSATCLVHEDGHQDQCQLNQKTGNADVDKAFLHWLEGNAGFVLQPAYENGHPVARTKTWSIELTKS
jgi:predicted aspartyl protease